MKKILLPVLSVLLVQGITTKGNIIDRVTLPSVVCMTGGALSFYYAFKYGIQQYRSKDYSLSATARTAIPFVLGLCCFTIPLFAKDTLNSSTINSSVELPRRIVNSAIEVGNRTIIFGINYAQVSMANGSITINRTMTIINTSKFPLKMDKIYNDRFIIRGIEYLVKAGTYVWNGTEIISVQ